MSFEVQRIHTVVNNYDYLDLHSESLACLNDQDTEFDRYT